MSNEPNERLNVVLTEYKALRNEITMKLQGVYQIYSLYFIALTLFYGLIFGKVSTGLYDLIFLLPVVALALFLRLLYDQLVIRKIDNYERRLARAVVPKILTATRGRKSDIPKVMQWLNFYRYKIPPYYKCSYFIIFPMLSVLPPLWFNIIAIGQYYTLCKWFNDIACSFPAINVTWLPIWFLWLSIFGNSYILIWMIYKIFKDKF